MKDAINKAGSWASSISSVGKIIIGLILLVIAVATAWYQIETNALENVRQDGDIKNMIKNQQTQFNRMMENVSKEFEIQTQRSDKRYQRAMTEAQHLHDDDDRLEEKIEKLEEQDLELIKEIWYLKGKLGE